MEKRLLCSSQSPIVLLRRKSDYTNIKIAESVAPGNPYLGVMLAYTPLHHLLMAKIKIPGGGHLREFGRGAHLHRRA